MRLIRVLAVAAALGTLAVQTSAAQGDRPFKDAWFWGVKSGALLYTSQSTSNGAAPILGGEWLIVRSQGGLYLSLDQAFLTTTGGFIDRDPDSSSTFMRKVNLNNVRRFNAVAMAFPWQSVNLHPYVGGGLSLQAIGSAALVTPISNPARNQVAQDSIVDKKAVFTPVFVAGLQLRELPWSAFAQVVVSPVQQKFFLSDPGGSRPIMASIEAGIRWNVGSSIDRSR